MATSQNTVLEQLVRHTTDELAAGHRNFLVRLNPVSLGTVEMTFTKKDGAYVLSIAAQLQSTEGLIESDMERLKAAFDTILTQLSSVSEPS